MALGWYGACEIGERGWTCGYCGKTVGGNIGYRREREQVQHQFVYICPHCHRPTAFVFESDEWGQYPAPASGNEVGHLPSDVADLYGQIRRCVQYSAPVPAVLAMRKLIMHVAVDLGAEEGGTFASYVDFLDSGGWLPSSCREWVDDIRKTGNVATHEIAPVRRDDAQRLLEFSEMILTIVYDFPARLGK
ncbi:DUF4145 domain-containing protein [Adlercreutzia equolifaciens]|uniref:DUF4145 domain-containing protein n=1 Tax=Adlercreutzia equolifaciens TaxID=446660 RepID=UPI001CC4C7D3|nr:DUF4145 domain-containing protein [Adlercreutzia equolifaciens]GJC75262.1 hypothetical protein Aeq9CBH6_05970 [Adlercreutzia equolifaciens]